jgi:hypothetical protein
MLLSLTSSLSLVIFLTGAPGKAPKAKPSAPAAVAETARSPAELLAQARQQYDALEYDKVIALTHKALGNPQITLEQKLVAYELEGSALAIVGDPVDADKPFRLLLNEEPDFDLPATTPPKILAIFRKVKGEIQQIRLLREQKERAALAKTVALRGDIPKTADGGRPVSFSFSLDDPKQAIRTVRVQYRRRGEPDFQSLLLAQQPDGSYAGQVSSEWTANDLAFAMEVYVVAADEKGALQTLQSAEAPAAIAVSAGQIDLIEHPVPLWVFVTAATTTGIAALAGSGLAVATVLTQRDYDNKVASSTQASPVFGGELRTIATLGERVETAQFVSWGTLALFGVVTAILTPFTDFDGTDGKVAEGTQ